MFGRGPGAVEVKTCGGPGEHPLERLEDTPRAPRFLRNRKRDHGCLTPWHPEWLWDLQSDLGRPQEP